MKRIGLEKREVLCKEDVLEGIVGVLLTVRTSSGFHAPRAWCEGCRRAEWCFVERESAGEYRECEENKGAGGRRGRLCICGNRGWGVFRARL